ncbi:putative dipeptidyl-aminopeptidase B [Teratosphaeria destructans]|uniref:dipeptidyl-peptidase IV n=1 Tax=Teratosphaeria destructans TaxID=418781 RepID=A0A9W7SN74_9PEZI|nr:putative dipeptidyl-aminopeptidase B [Teratosphaeria destructans]
MGLHRRTPSVNRAMANEFHAESQPLHHVYAHPEAESRLSPSSASTTSLVLEHISDKDTLQAKEAMYDAPQDDIEGMAWQRQPKPSDKRARRIFYVLIAVGLVGWVAAFFLFLSQDRHLAHSSRPHDPHATATQGNGKKVTLEQVLTGGWYARKHEIRWIAGPDGEDGLLLERGGGGGRGYLVVEDVRYRGDDVETQKSHSKTLMKHSDFQVGKEKVTVDEAWPSPDHKKVLVRSDYTSNWRHSGTGRYWIFDVETQTGEALDPNSLFGRVQVAQWSPQSNAVAFTRDNNLFIRHLDASEAQRITNDGGSELFYGVPDWVYEEEVLSGDTATWWDGDGKFVAFFRTDESQVPSYPVQYFFSSPTGSKKQKGQENYPETREIKYPKAGAPNPLVSLQFYDVDKGEVFTVPIEGDFAEDDRIITEVVWAGKTGKVIVRSTNREQDILKTILIDAKARSGKTVRERDVQKLDGGWFEITESTTFVPADAAAGRPHDGYVDTIIHEGFDHLAYFSPLDRAEPQMLTEGEWEVVKAPSAVDMKNNLVYFVSTKHGSTQRHIYTVDLLKGPSSIEAVTNTSSIGYYDATFSAGSQFMLLSYAGPDIPFQKVLATPSNKAENTDIMIETNSELRDLAQRSELPINVFSTVNVDGYDLNIVERRPPHFDPNKKYPVLFYLYNGPGFQLVDRKFTVDFQAYVASSLGYIVVSLDGLGTGYLGRKQRTIVRGNIGYWEAYSQIAAAKQLAKKQYVDPDRMAIWGWSYGGFMSLKTLEQDAGQTFKYGMAVAPVTDWRYYDSIYTERYMHTPQHNPGGYENASISNATALSQNVRFLVMHGFSDDNVHFQNTLSLLDKLDLANVRNYDVHVFPDSDHSIYFHNGNRVVYEKLSDWLVNAFNGEWLKTDDPKPAGVHGGG